jgi:hypothetical protein
MKALLILSLLLSTISLKSQSFEYVLTEIAGSTFNDVVFLDDKIMMATNVGFCHNAGIALFDTLGNRLSVTGYTPYFSIAPSICKAEGNTSYLLTFKNESEEFYDVNQMIVHKLDQFGEVVKSRIDTTYEFDFDGQILNANNELIVLCGSYFYRYSQDLELIDTFRITAEPYSDFDYDIINIIGSQWILIRRHVEYLIDSRPLITDQIIVFDRNVNNLNTNIENFDLTSIQGISSYTSSAVYIYGSDEYLRRFDLTSFTVSDSFAWSDIRDFKVLDHEGKTYFSVLTKDSSIGIFTIDFTNQKLDTIWSLYSNEHLFAMAGSGDHILLLTKLHLDDGSYRPMNYPVLRNIPLSAPFMIQREEISLEAAEVLQFYEKENHGPYPEGSFVSTIPAIVGITVKNNSADVIENFGYFSESTGGSFCVPGRTKKYLEGRIESGATYYFEDTIYPYLGPAVEFKLSFHVSAPNHKLDINTTNNSATNLLFTTAIQENYFKRIGVYPNPSSDILYLEGADQNDAMIRVVDCHGKLVLLTKDWKNGISMVGLPSGVYYVQYITLQGQKQNLILKH